MQANPERPVPFRDAVLFWLKLGFINFGGPTGQIAIMHDELVERRRWIGNERFLHALNYCMLLPGPEAQQLAVYVGWLLHRTIGGLVAGIFFILPGFALMLALSWLRVAHGDVAWVAGVFGGVRAAVIAIVAAAVIRIGSKALKRKSLVALAVTAFVAIFLLKVPFPAIVIGAGALGFLHRARGGSATPATDAARPSVKRAVLVALIGLAVWWGPLMGVRAWRGKDDVLSREAVFFSQAAMVTFGGAYAVLAYMNQAAVERYRWLEPGEMLDGLGLAESTPGPLIMVTEYVGFIGAYRHANDLPPLAAGILGALVATWATFAPCFLWIFLGAPFVERLRGRPRLDAALSGITAAVVGVIASLAVWFSIHTLFREVGEARLLGLTLPSPAVSSLDPFAIVVAAASFYVLWRRRWGVIPVVGASAAAGLLDRFVF